MNNTKGIGRMREFPVQDNQILKNNENEAEIPVVFSHSVKITQTARGCRIEVHAYANDGPDAINEAVKLYLDTKTRLEQEGQIIAPIEIRTTNGEK